MGITDSASPIFGRGGMEEPRSEEKKIDEVSVQKGALDVYL